MRTLPLVSLLLLAGAPNSTQDIWGTWTMNPSRSRLGPQDAGAITVRIEPHAKGEVFTYERTGPNGRATLFSVVLYFDGQERSSQSHGCAGTLHSRRLEDGVVEIVWRCQGGSSIRFVRRRTNTDDMVLDETEHQPNRAAVERRLVLEKQRAERR